MAGAGEPLQAVRGHSQFDCIFRQ